MNFELRTVIVATITLLVIFLLAELNHYLTAFHVHLYLGGLFITFPFLRFRFQQGFLFACIIAVFVDATTPAPFGTSLVLFLAIHAVIYTLRSRFPREELVAAVGVAFVVNAMLFLTISVLQAPETPFGLPYWRRVLADLLLSQVTLLLIASWFFSLQFEALRFFGIHLDQEQRQAE